MPPSEYQGNGGNDTRMSALSVRTRALQPETGIRVGGSSRGVLEGRDPVKGRSPRVSEVEAGVRCQISHRCKNMFDI